MGVITDIQDPLTVWAKHHLNVSDEDLKSGKIRLEIDTHKLRFTTCDQKYTNISSLDGNGSPSGVVFKSRYVNKTDSPQEHTFIMERTTEATVTTSLSKGFTRNGTVGIKVDVPESVLEETGGFGTDVTIETEDEATVKHSLTWSINSKVNAPKGKTTVAELRIKEKRSEFTFSADIIMKGRVLAQAVDVETGKSLKQIFGNIAEILDNENYNGNFNPSAHGATVNVGERKVTWKVAGSMKFRFGVSQDVQVAHE